MIVKITSIDVSASRHYKKMKAGDFNVIAHHIGTDWKRLGRYLLVDDNILDAIDYEYRQLYEKAYQMLRRWNQSQKNEQESAEALTRVLTDIGRMDIVGKLRL